MNANDSPRLFDTDDFEPSRRSPGSDLLTRATPALVALWRGLARRKGVIALSALVGLVLGWLAILLITPIYQASSTLLIESGKARVVSIEEVVAGMGAEREQMQTQVQFLRSREVALRVVRDLRLIDDPVFKDVVATARGKLQGAQAPVQAPAMRAGASAIATAERDVKTDPVEEAVVEAFIKMLDVEPVRQSQLVMVKFSASDPELAARIANRTAESFIQAEMDMRLQMTVRASEWLAERVAELKNKLDVSERLVADARERANLIERKGGSASSTTSQQVDDFAQRLVDARVKRAQLEQVYNQVRAGAAGREAASPVVNDPGVRRAREVLAESENAFASVRSRLGQSHPQYVNAAGAVAAAQANLRRQTDVVIASIAKDYQVTVATEQSLLKALNETKRAALLDGRTQSEIALLEQDASATRQLYGTFLQRLKETGTASDVQRPVARIVDAAVMPSRPVHPRKTLLSLASALAGLLAGVGIALFLNQNDKTIGSIEELEEALGIPVVAALPLLSRALQKIRGRLAVEKPDEYFSEMIRMGAASLHFSTLDKSIRSIAITSAVASEGKSTVAVNLALALSRTSRVLLIDADLYRPNVHRLLGSRNSQTGLVKVLMGEVEISDAIHRMPGTRLAVMPSGPVEGRAFSIVTPSHLKRLIAMMEERFDLIIIDAPPLEVVSDAMLIAGSCSATLVVTRSGATSVTLLQKSLKRLSRIGARVLGVVLNGHDFKKAQRYYGESSGYESYEAYTRESDGQARADSDSLIGKLEPRTGTRQQTIMKADA